MNKVLASLVLVGLLSGCATRMPAEYQVGSAAQKQSKGSAEESHAEQTAAIVLPGYDSSPQVITSRFPDYPQNWRNAGIQGPVVVRFTIGTDGTVSNPSVAGAPPPELAAIVLHAIMQWKVRPAMKNGHAVAVRAQQEFSFKVN